MIRTLLILAVLKLASASHVTVPKIIKEVDGTIIEVNVEVDIDTGDDASGPIVDPRPSTSAPITRAPTAMPATTPEECVPKWERCRFDLECCEGLECYGNRIVCMPKELIPTDPIIGPRNATQCLNVSEPCINDEECCEGICQFSPWPVYPPRKVCGPKPDTPPTAAPPTTPEQCLPEGEHCRIDQDCCEGMVCYTSPIKIYPPIKLCKYKDVIPTEPTLPTLPPPTTPKECLTVLKRCGDGQDCCEGLTCKETVWKPIAEKVCVPEQETTSAPLTTPGPDQCQKAGQRCEPGTPSQPSTLVCCPNHLCDLDSKVCRRVAYRQLDLDGKKAYRWFGLDNMARK